MIEIINNKKKKTPAFVPFGSTDVRFGENPEAELPGPGAYEIKNDVQRFSDIEMINDS